MVNDTTPLVLVCVLDTAFLCSHIVLLVLLFSYDSLVESGAPAQISFGFGMGICCGFAAKKTAKAALVGIGLAFGSLQVSQSVT